MPHVYCRPTYVQHLASQTGRSAEDILACVVSEHNGWLLLDESCVAMPAGTAVAASPPMAPPSGGAGTNLKRVFARAFGQKASPNCSCQEVAAQMDRMGPQWCRDNMEWILEQVKSNAEKRGLPYIRAVVEPIVLLAIRKAERDQKAAE